MTMIRVETRGRKKGCAKTGGRPPGGQNKMTRELKDMILGALDAKGGIEYLTEQAGVNPVAFMSLLGKVLPLTLANPAGEAFRIENEILSDDELNARIFELATKIDQARID